MKKYIVLLVLIIMNCSCKAQQPVLRTLTFEEFFDEYYSSKKGDYVKDTQNQLDPYVGIWKYQGTEKTLILKIQKVTMIYNSINKTYIDKLLVTYKYIKNGVVVVDNLDLPIVNSFQNMSYDNAKKYGTFSLNKYNNELFLSGSITDIPLNILTNTDIYPIDFNIIGVTPKIKIQYNGLMSYRGNPASFYVGKPTFELPNNVVLVKQ
ncbi:MULTISPECIES: DUF6705 family protein [Chryseobacterium]|uniref:DUF6705 domain-containing protein n=1 Tax=Chryseobacterium taihuense TaxID=1141221 RepID=A0A4U8WDQ1_9FLAO|nr:MULTISPECIES: DUF6705 family protein [Chryseobacterium]QQV03647.1 hypothetical protein I6I61_04735 [Chryseobacterium sp. FDAARGOS 1104]VFB03015.1 Uncharacterised protein [Chryseobacterium taihuense]